MIARIDFQTNDRIRAVISSLGRTEDVRFSPDNRLLAIAGFGRNRCLILQVDVAPSPADPRVSINDYMELTSEGIGSVHGIDFIDNQTLVAANRDGLIAILRLPSGALAGRHCQVDALRQIRGGPFCKLKTPGSVVVKHERNGWISLLVCNNYAHHVTRHVLSPRSYRAWRNRILLQSGLNLPDGIALSHDGQWIAVSSHYSNDVQVYRASGPLGPKTKAAGVLSEANYPHGLRFTADDRHILVSDAGGPALHVYDRGADWSGVRAPAREVVVLDDETFARGRSNPEEGGIKGLDIDRTNSVVAVTCEEQPLAFFTLASILDDQASQAAGEMMSA